jgi:hypothetical protein
MGIFGRGTVKTAIFAEDLQVSEILDQVCRNML